MAVILDHKAQARARLLSQFRNKVRIEGTSDAVVEQWQELEQVFCDLNDFRLDIDATEGVQLDLIGEIVGQPRENRNDVDYRIRLKTRIIQNIAEGEPEPIIQVTALLTGATLVHLSDGDLGAFAVGIDITTPTDDDIQMLYENIQLVAPAGVRLDYLWCFQPGSDPFAMAGNLPGSGFSAIASPGSGGKLAGVHIRKFPKFAFSGIGFPEGNNPKDDGLSTVVDPFIGGSLIGV